LAVLKWNGREFRITRQLANRNTLEEWLSEEGSLVLAEATRTTRVRWFFGKTRARRALINEVYRALRPDGRLSETLSRELTELPKLLRQIGSQIRRRKHRDLYTIDSSVAVAVVVVPRAVVVNELRVYLFDRLLRAHSLERFKGLPARILRDIAVEAEQCFFDFISSGKQYMHTNRRSLVLGADGDFRWRMNGIDGHYYCAYSADGSRDLARWRDKRAFDRGMKEVMVGQTVHLTRLRGDEVETIAEAFKTR
jgi:hypothetical protein